MNETTKEMLKTVADFDGEFKGAYNIRVNGACASRQSTEHIKIETKNDAPGLVVTIDADTKGETVYVPACVTAGGVDDLVYNDFYIGENADVVIVAGSTAMMLQMQNITVSIDFSSARVRRFFIKKST